MGYILKGVCKNCEYETKNLYYGAGFMNAETICDFPGIDKVKKVIEMKNIMEKKNVNKEFPNFAFYDNKSLFDKNLRKIGNYHEWGKYKLYCEGNHCPKCNQFSLEFIPLGCWD
jgi:hypothetical protein